MEFITGAYKCIDSVAHMHTYRPPTEDIWSWLSYRTTVPMINGRIEIECSLFHTLSLSFTR